MTGLQIVVLAVVQGLTEFLPVSSSAHLILISRLLAWPDQGLVLDVAVHLGTLLAAMFYFRADLVAMAAAVARGGGDAERQRQRLLALALAVASVPALLAGWLAWELIAGELRSLRVIAITTLVFGLLLWVADARFPRHRGLGDMSLRAALWIGLAQAVALVPGVSRSGVTITMGRFLGFDAGAAARFSFLLSIPVIGAAGAHGIWLLASGQVAVAWQSFLTAMVCAAFAGWVCIAAFLALLRRVGLVPFIAYRLVLGACLAYIAF